MFGVIGFAFGLMFGTSRFALRNVVRASAFGLIGYLVYELISGYGQGKARAEADRATDAAYGRATRGGRATQGLSESPLSARYDYGVDPRATMTSSSRSPLHGGVTGHGDDLDEIDVPTHTARVGRGVVRR